MRLSAPLCYNFLTFTRQQGTSLQKIVSAMDVVPFFGSDLNVWLPLLILFFCVANGFNLYSKALKKLHISRFDFEDSEAESSTNAPEKDEGLSASEITEGKRLLHKARTKGITGLGQREFELIVLRNPREANKAVQESRAEEPDLENEEGKDLGASQSHHDETDASLTPFLAPSNEDSSSSSSS